MPAIAQLAPAADYLNVRSLHGHFYSKSGHLATWPFHKIFQHMMLRRRGHRRRYPLEVARLAAVPARWLEGVTWLRRSRPASSQFDEGKFVNVAAGSRLATGGGA